jgi:hypothetical protein
MYKTDFFFIRYSASKQVIGVVLRIQQSQDLAGNLIIYDYLPGEDLEQC